MPHNWHMASFGAGVTLIVRLGLQLVKVVTNHSKI